MEIQYEYAGKSYPVRIKKEGEVFKVGIGDNEFTVTRKEIKPGYFILNIDGKPVKVCIATVGNQRHIFFNGAVYRFTRAEGKKRKSDGYDLLSPEINSPISGKVVKIDVEEGDVVKVNQTLMAIEAMKMEYQIKAPFAGMVENIMFKQGDQVDIGVILIKMKKQETGED